MATPDKIFDLRKNFDWTISPKEKRINVPFIEMVEYTQKQSAIITSANFWLFEREAFINEANPYKGLYIVDDEVQGIYVLPFFEQYHHRIENSWQQSKGTIFEQVAQLAAQVQQFVFQPTAGIETPQYWSGSTHANYTISFHLLNTGGMANIIENQRLIDALINASLQDRKSSTVVTPPSLFEIIVPGVRHCPMAAIANLQVENVGQINRIFPSEATGPELTFSERNEGRLAPNNSSFKNKLREVFGSNRSFKNKLRDVGENIPDAWRVTINIQELIVESKQIYGNFKDGSVIRSWVSETEAQIVAKKHRDEEYPRPSEEIGGVLRREYPSNIPEE